MAGSREDLRPAKEIAIALGRSVVQYGLVVVVVVVVVSEDDACSLSLSFVLSTLLVALALLSCWSSLVAHISNSSEVESEFEPGEEVRFWALRAEAEVFPLLLLLLLLKVEKLIAS